MEDRYNRHITLEEIGLAGQRKLHQAKVLVVGAGGLGCPALQYLAAAGIGTLGIVDYDVVELSNLQRQILFGTSDIGKNKALVARERLQELNPTITINAYPERLNPDNVIRLLALYDMVVDGTDNFATRYLINDASVLLEKPLVYGAIFKYEGQLAVFNYQDGPSYRCLFPSPPSAGSVPNCSEIGVLGVLPGIIGSMQANEVLKIILGIGKPLSGSLFCYSTLTNESSVIKISRMDDTVQDVKERGENFEFTNDEVCDATQLSEIKAEEIGSVQNIQFLDVRNAYETPRIGGLDVLEIPLDMLQTNLDRISESKKVIVFCKSGVRSAKAVAILRESGRINCFSLKGGAQSLLKTELS